MDKWEELKIHLRLQASQAEEALTVLHESESHIDLMLMSENKYMNLAYISDKNRVRWETATQYGFERMDGAATELATKLMKFFHYR
jgi:hypothetical protein